MRTSKSFLGFRLARTPITNNPVSPYPGVACDNTGSRFPPSFRLWPLSDTAARAGCDHQVFGFPFRVARQGTPHPALCRGRFSGTMSYDRSSDVERAAAAAISAHRARCPGRGVTFAAGRRPRGQLRKFVSQNAGQMG